MDSVIRPLRALLQPQSRFQWKAVQPGVFQREVDSTEVFHLVNGSRDVPQGRNRAELAYVIVVSLTGDQTLSAQDARSAWVALRKRHPTISAVVQGSKKIYRQGSDDELNHWCDETFLTIPEEETVTPALLHRSHAPERPTLYFLEKSLTFLVRTPHHAIDGIGITRLMDEFVLELDRVLATPGPETTSVASPDLALSRCLREVIGSALPSPLNLFRARSLLRMPTNKSIKIEPDRAGNGSYLSTWSDLRYPPSTTTQLISAAKAHALSVTHVVHAALGVAIKQHGGFDYGCTYSGATVLDLRRRMASAAKPSSPPLSSSSSAYSTPSTSTPTGLERDDDLISGHHTVLLTKFPVTTFLDTACRLKEIYENATTRPQLGSMAGLNFLGATNSIAARPRETYGGAPLFSSIGNLDQIVKHQHGAVVVEDVSLSLEMCTEEIYVAVWTFRGELTVRVAYNEAFHSGESIGRVVRLLDEVLSGGLGVWREKV